MTCPRWHSNLAELGWFTFCVLHHTCLPIKYPSLHRGGEGSCWHHISYILNVYKTIIFFIYWTSIQLAKIYWVPAWYGWHRHGWGITMWYSEEEIAELQLPGCCYGCFQHEEFQLNWRLEDQHHHSLWSPRGPDIGRVSGKALSLLDDIPSCLDHSRTQTVVMKCCCYWSYCSLACRPCELGWATYPIWTFLFSSDVEIKHTKGNPVISWVRSMSIKMVKSKWGLVLT